MLTTEGNCYRGKITYYKTNDISTTHVMYFGPHHTPAPVKGKMTKWKRQNHKIVRPLDEAVQISTEWTDLP